MVKSSVFTLQKQAV